MDFERLHQRLLSISGSEFYLIESDFCIALYDNIPEEKKPLCVIAFLTIANWFGTSQRSGVWTFYEACSPEEIQRTLQFLKQSDHDDFTSIFDYGIHDYQNHKYAGNYDYPEEWISEADKIDNWIFEHEEWLVNWERNLLLDNKELICSF